MSSTLVAAPETLQQISWTAGLQVGASGVESAGSVSVTDTLSVKANRATAGSVPTFYRLDCVPVTGLGLTANNLQVTGQYDAALTSSTTIEHANIYAVTSTGVAGSAALSVFQTNNSKPLNYTAPWIGTTTGNGGTPVVVACVGIPATASIRFFLAGGSIAAFAAGIAAPSAVSVQANVSFTYTGTSGAIYGYEVLLA